MALADVHLYLSIMSSIMPLVQVDGFPLFTYDQCSILHEAWPS